jgi:hypothetical protein
MIALFCLYLALFASPFKSKSRLEAENAALRHQLIILRRKVRGRRRLWIDARSQHRGAPVRYLLEDRNGVTPFRSLEEVERRLRALAQEGAKGRPGSEVT